MHRNFWVLGLVPLVFLASCDSSRVSSGSASPLVLEASTASAAPSPTAPVKLAPPQAASQSAQPSQSTPASPIAPSLLPSASSNTAPSETAGEPASTAAPENSVSLEQDYGPTTPLPETGQVTIRNDIRNLDLNQLIARCPTDSSPYAFAESTNYRVQICSAEYDPWQPKYYIGQSKQGNEELQITSTDPDAARQLIFEQAGYTYVLSRDSRSGADNAYLQVFTPRGSGYAEALLYFYETSPLQLPR